MSDLNDLVEKKYHNANMIEIFIVFENKSKSIKTP